MPKRAQGKKPGPPVHDDLSAAVTGKGLTRHVFTADAPNRLWLADITEHRTGERKLYLCVVKDVYSNRIVGYSMDPRMKSRLAVTALENAVARRGGLVLLRGVAVKDVAPAAMDAFLASMLNKRLAASTVRHV